MASLYVYLPKATIEYLSKKIPGLSKDARSVSQEDLDTIEEINIRDVDIMYLQYFRNLKTLVIDSTPDIDDKIFNTINRNCNSVETLVIKNQPKLNSIDISGFVNLKNLSIVSNENLVDVDGLYDADSVLKTLDTLEFYDNINFKKDKKLIEYLTKNDNIKNLKLDALYYIDFINRDGNRESEKNYKWHEKIGFKNQRNLSYTNGEMNVAYEYAKAITNNIIKPDDSAEMIITVLYAWIIKNINLEEERNLDMNEGILNVFKYRVASAPTVAKYYQFLLKVVGIDSYDINVLPRVLFNNSINGSFKIPSDDYEILMIPTKKGQKFFDLVWDMDITNKIDKDSVLFMYNGLSDIAYNHRLVYANNLEDSDSYSIEDREKLLSKAKKRLQNVKSQKITQLIGNDEDVYAKIVDSHSFLQDKMSSYIDKVNKLVERKEKLINKMDESDYDGKKKYVERIKNLNLMINAAEQSNKTLRHSLYSMEEGLLNHLLQEDLSEIESRLEYNISPFKYVNNEKMIKSKEELNEELNRIHNILNREVTSRMITISEYRAIKEKADKVYTSLITFAFEKSILVDSLEETNERIKKSA